MALFLVSQGVPQTLKGYGEATGLEGVAQTLAWGPIASQEAIKELGTNGGGFLNANSAHPYREPQRPHQLCRNARHPRHPGRAYLHFRPLGERHPPGLGDLRRYERYLPRRGDRSLLGRDSRQPCSRRPGNRPIAGNLEGKEVRFGVPLSALFAVVTTVTSCGAVNSMHDSFNALGGMIPLADIHLGEIVFGGVGSGLAVMLLFAILAVFLAGLMVGRTPEFLGKKVQAYEVKMVALAILIFPGTVLAFTGLASVVDWGTATLNNGGPHGFSEMLYAYSSGTGNNGSAFAGLGANNGFYNSSLGFAMLIGRFLILIPVLAVAGSLVRKQALEPGLGTFPTTGKLWVGLLVGVILIVGLLTFFPALALGPVVEHFMGNDGITF